MGPDRVTLPGTAPAPRGVCCQAQGLPRTGGWLAARPSSPGVRLECCARGQGPRGSQTHPVQQAAQGQTRPGLQEAALCHRLSVAVSAAGEGGMRFQCERPSVPGLCPSAHRGPRSSSSQTGERPRGPGACQEGRWDRGRGREAESGASGSPAVGGLAGRPGVESLELGKCRGLLQGLLLGLTLAPALEVQVGTAGQARDLPPRPP